MPEMHHLILGNETFEVTDAAARSDIDKLSTYVTPEMFGAVGDGETDDTSALQSAINSGKKVFVPKGIYCISQSLKLITGQTLEGDGDWTTIIKVTSDCPAFENGGNANYIAIRNIKIESDVESTNYAIDIKGSITSPYTGATYSSFENIFIRNFDSGIFLNHVWNTKLKNIRVANGTTNGIFLGGGCNNIIIELPMLERLKCGIRLTTSDSDTTENVDVTIINPDIEYCEKGIYAFNHNTLNIIGAYSEHNDLVINCSGVKGLSVNGIYSAYDNKYADLSNTNASLTDAFVKLNSDSDIGIISSDKYLSLDNFTGVNLGSGKMFYLTYDINSYVPFIYETLQYNIESASFRLRYSSDKYDGTFEAQEKTDKQFSCFKPCLVVTSNTLTASSSDTIRLYRNGSIVATASISSGTVLNNGDIIEMTAVNTNAKNFIYENGDEYSIQHSNTTGVDVNFKVVFRNTKKGKFIIN